LVVCEYGVSIDERRGIIMRELIV
jgi:hypothetical protein